MTQKKNELFSSRIMKQGKFQIVRSSTLLNANGEKVSSSDFNSGNKYIDNKNDKIVLTTEWFETLEGAYNFYKNLYGIVMMECEDKSISPKPNDNEFVFRFQFGDRLIKRVYESLGKDCTYDDFRKNINNDIAEKSVKFNNILQHEISVQNDYIEYKMNISLKERYAVKEELLKLIQLINLYILISNEDLDLENMKDKLKQFNEIYNLGMEEAVNNIDKKNDNEEDIIKYIERNKKLCYAERFKLLGYEDLQLSTQILMKEAIKEGIEVKVIDRTENFISLKKGDKVEYIKEATKTSLDSYITVLIMENKVVTKKVVEAKGICVPKGLEFNSMEEALDEIDEYVGLPSVIKPKSTNFGIGISIFPEGGSKEDLIDALKIAFSNDKTVLLEEFIKGKEYRFLVIDGEVAGILNRVPANVVGDGVRTIEELVAEKNLDPLRGKGYKTPLEKINLDDNAKLFLKQSNLDEKYVPKKDETVFLRENSNISTGGDSVDYTDDIPDRFKKIAVDAAASAKARICGVDMIIEDYKDEQSKYSIIELNFNPAIHIHSYPYVGKERKIASKILKILF